MILEIAQIVQNMNILEIVKNINILEIAKNIVTVFSIFGVIISAGVYSAKFCVKALGIMPSEAYLDKEIARYAKMHKETEDEQVKKILLEEITCLRKQKIARRAVRITCAHWIYDVVFLSIGLLVMCMPVIVEILIQAPNSWLILFQDIAFTIVLFMGLFILVFEIIFISFTTGERNNIYNFYLVMLETKYEEIVSANPRKLLEKYKEMLLNKKNKNRKEKKQEKRAKNRNLILFPRIIISQNQAANEVVKLLDEESKKEADNGGETQC